MNKIRLMLTIAFLALLGACTQIDDYIIDNGKLQGEKITIKASVEDLKITTRAGIVEGNADFSSGEKFYWVEGDEIRLYFVGATEISSSLFKAENVDGSSADFTGTIPSGLNGEYTIYAAKDLEQANPTSTQLSMAFPKEQTQTGASTKGILLPMLSLPIENVMIEEGVLGDGISLDFSLKQLNALLRFTFENNTSQALTIEKIVISVENEENEPVTLFANKANIDMNPNLPILWSNIDTTLPYDQLTLMVKQNGQEATIDKEGKFDAYLSFLPLEGFADGDNFVIEATFKGEDGNSYRRKGEIEVSNNGDFAFLSTGMKAAQRYYFKSDLTIDNTFKISIVTFEDKEGTSYWSSLIDSPQYGGPLLYGDYVSTDYEWMDEASGLYSGNYGKVYWSGGIAISNYYSEDYETYGDYEKQLTVYGTGGNNGSKNCAVSFGYSDNSGLTSPEWQPKMHFEDGIAKTIDHMYIAPTTYFYNVAVNGNPLSPAVGDDDVWITATGYLSGTEGNTITTYMIKGGISVINSWTKWDLSGLGKVDEVVFNIGGGTDNGYGFSLPAYFAIDDIMIIHN